MNYKNVFLKRGKDESLKRFHPWVFSGAIERMDDGMTEGETVRVCTSDGDFIAVGHYQIGSIAIRVLSFRDVTIDADFWQNRLLSAFQMRMAIGVVGADGGNDTFRLVHGEGDLLPGLVIDCYGRTAVMQAHSVGMHLCRQEICEALLVVMGKRIDHVYYKSDTTLPFKAELGHENGFLVGGSQENTAVETV